MSVYYDKKFLKAIQELTKFYGSLKNEEIAYLAAMRIKNDAGSKWTNKSKRIIALKS